MGQKISYLKRLLEVSERERVKENAERAKYIAQLVAEHDRVVVQEKAERAKANHEWVILLVLRDLTQLAIHGFAEGASRKGIRLIDAATKGIRRRVKDPKIQEALLVQFNYINKVHRLYVHLATVRIESKNHPALSEADLLKYLKTFYEVQPCLESLLSLHLILG
jgi:hypothetical protein